MCGPTGGGTRQLYIMRLFEYTGRRDEQTRVYPYISRGCSPIIVCRHAGDFQGTGDRKTVAIAGGGLAGLSCAYELSKRGFNVTVLEGQGRPGGRVVSLREGLAPGLIAETGATRIPDTHDFTLSYVREFGLPLEVLKSSGSKVIRLRGKDYTIGKGPALGRLRA
jgi:NADPH-dependent 2,4-dienoyl-CoA reductase/sulfur reductase-like enzyme